VPAGGSAALIRLASVPRRRTALLGLILLALAVLGAGCGFRKEPTAETQVQPVFPLTVRDALGRKVDLAALPKRVVTLDPGAQRILRSIGVNAQLLPSSTRLDSLGKDQADLIVLPGSTPAGTADKLTARAGVPTFIFAGVLLQPMEHAALSLGIATGHTAAGEALARKLKARRLDIAHRLKGLETPDVFVDVVGLGVPPQPHSLLATIVRLAGGRLVGTSDVSTTLSAAQLAKLDPDWYVTTKKTGLTLQRMRSQPRLAKLRAIRDGRFVILDQKRFQTDDQIYGLIRSLARRLHPDAFS
jgi:ABC-type Fe3+-hydroxamate transport system substrate-binding protein